MFCATDLVTQRDNGEQVVRTPRATDAVGSALRNVYGENSGIPHDLSVLLRKIDQVSYRHH
jgi:hypothetical protein